MKKMKNFMAIVAATILTVVAKAQEAGTYIDSLNVQDSSYMQPLEPVVEEKSSNSMIIIGIVVVVLVAIVIFVATKKKKK